MVMAINVHHDFYHTAEQSLLPNIYIEKNIFKNSQQLLNTENISTIIIIILLFVSKSTHFKAIHNIQ